MRKQITNYKIKTIKQITRQKSAALHVPVVQGSMQWCCALRGIFIFCFSFKISFMKKNAHWGAFWFCISSKISLMQKNGHRGAFRFFVVLKLIWCQKWNWPEDKQSQASSHRPPYILPCRKEKGRARSPLMISIDMPRQFLKYAKTIPPEEKKKVEPDSLCWYLRYAFTKYVHFWWANIRNPEKNVWSSEVCTNT